MPCKSPALPYLTGSTGFPSGFPFPSGFENDIELHFQSDILGTSPGACPVIVCHCKAVSDCAIRDAIRRGAQTPREVAFACQAGRGRQCGGCIPLVRELIVDETTRADANVVPVVAAS